MLDEVDTETEKLQQLIDELESTDIIFQKSLKLRAGNKCIPSYTILPYCMKNFNHP